MQPFTENKIKIFLWQVHIGENAGSNDNGSFSGQTKLIYISDNSISVMLFCMSSSNL